MYIWGFRARQHLGLLAPVMNDDNDGQMILGDLRGLKLPDIYLTGEEIPWKIPHPGNLSRPGLEPKPAAWQACMLLPGPQQCTDAIEKSVYLFHEHYSWKCSREDTMRNVLLWLLVSSNPNISTLREPMAQKHRKQKLPLSVPSLLTV